MKRFSIILILFMGLGALLWELITPGFRVKAQTGYRPTPTPWLPMNVEVLPEANYHNGIDQIKVLPVAHCYAGNNCPWVGDLEAADHVKLTGLSFSQEFCFIEGKAIQGWEVKGWVPCYRLKPVAN